MDKPTPGEIFNVCDDEPAAQPDPITYAASLLDLPLPPLVSLEDAKLSSLAQEMFQANRRMRNNKIKSMLGVQLHYPSYREGLRQCLESIPAEARAQMVQQVREVMEREGTRALRNQPVRPRQFVVTV